MRKRRVFLYGYYSVNNLGDDLLQKVAVQLIEEAVPGASVLVRHNLQVQLPIGTPELIKRFVTRVYLLISLSLNISRVARSRVIIFGGGGVFPVTLSWLGRFEQLLISLVARISGAAIAGIGLEISREAVSGNSKRAIAQRKVLSSFRFLWLRDEQSFGAVEDLRLRCAVVEGGDLVWLLATTRFGDGEPKRFRLKRGRIGLSIAPGVLGNSSFLEAEVKALNRLTPSLGSGARLVGISAQEYRNGDVEISDTLALRAIAAEANLAIDEVRCLSSRICGKPVVGIDELRDLDLVIVGRFHVAVLSLLAGTPVAVIPFSHKLRALASKLNLPLIEDTTDVGRIMEKDFALDEAACLREISTAQLAAVKFKSWLIRSLA